MIIFKLISESFIFSKDALVQNKMRTFLSLLGITIGIFLIIGIYTAVDTLRDKLNSSVEKLGSKTVFIDKWPWGGDGEYPWWKYMNRPVAQISDYQSLKNKIKLADAISYVASSENRTLKYNSNSIEGVSINAISEEYNQVLTLDFTEGRYFTENESSFGAQVCLIGADVATNLFKNEDPISKKINVLGKYFTIIGLMKKEGEDMLGLSQDKNVLIPLNAARSIFDVQNEKYSPQIMVKANDQVNGDEFEGELRTTLRAIRRLKPTQDDNFALNKSTIISEKLDTAFQMLNIAGAIIGGFSILVGGFSIANIMFVSVKERTNIIGIQKSLGAKSYFILLQFMFESVTLCILGGMCGLGLVYLGSLIATYGFDTKLHLSAGNIILGIGISVIIGLVSGFWPAYSASKMDPVEAIRS